MLQNSHQCQRRNTMILRLYIFIIVALLNLPSAVYAKKDLVGRVGCLSKQIVFNAAFTGSQIRDKIQYLKLASTGPNEKTSGPNPTSTRPHSTQKLISRYDGKSKAGTSKDRRTNTDHDKKYFKHTLECGQDAFFLKQLKNHHWMGIADGVGGSNYMAIKKKPDEFAWGLMKYISESVDEYISPEAALRKGHQKLKAMRLEKIIGPASSTALVLKYNKATSVLRTINLGDSGYMILRKGKIVYKSRPQQTRFNQPYQLSFAPVWNAWHGYSTSHTLYPRDVILVSSDGLTDNLHDGTIEHIVNEICYRTGKKGIECVEKDKLDSAMRTVMKSLIECAYKRVHDKKIVSPFFERYNKGFVIPRTGGKPDDVRH